MEPVNAGLIFKIGSIIYKIKNRIFDMFWIFKNATKIRNNFDKVVADKPCPVCKTEMSYSKKIQAVNKIAKMGKFVNTPIAGKYWFYYKCPNAACTFKDDVPFRYQSW